MPYFDGAKHTHSIILDIRIIAAPTTYVYTVLPILVYEYTWYIQNF